MLSSNGSPGTCIPGGQMTFLQYASRRTSSKGSSDTCISDGVSTFLYRAFTAHCAHLILVHARFTLASFQAGFNGRSRFDDPRQF
jgi:hypothetical protein